MHLEAGRTVILIHHYTLVVARILILRYELGCLFEAEFSTHYLFAERVETMHRITQILAADVGTKQNMAYVHLVAALLDELYDMIAVFGLYNS